MSSGGTQFGKYVLQRKLAEGGMAELFLARQTGPDFCEGFEKLVVIKRILPQLCSDDSFVNMFLNEARVAARLNHPNVVQIFDLGKLGEQYFIAMEYVHGEDLRAVIREATAHGARPPFGLACRIVADTLAGLHYAHTRVGGDGKPLGLVHRDVSPQNVLITYEGAVKLVDFGIAKATRAVNAAQTQAGLLKGKYAYMSPEQARGQPVDARADVFCAGILLWELATWQRLFKRPNEMATLLAVAEEPIRAPHTVEPSLPKELDRLIVKALARNPDERFASAQQMRAALESLIRTSGWEADALVLSNWMCELFDAKLQAQAADVEAAGVASLEDFLLRVEDRTSLSWMAAPGSQKKTPSMGLPSPPATDWQRAATYDDGPTRELYGDGETVPDPTTPPSSDIARTVAGVIVPSTGPLRASPTDATAAVVAPPMVPGSATPSMNLPPAQNPRFAGNKTTAQRPTYEEPPRIRRVLVASSAALLVAACALTIAFWPAAQRQAGETASVAMEPLAGGGASVTAASGAAAKPTFATLQIRVDAPANIAVDGQPQATGDSAIVNVQAGVEHVVTVQRPGHSARKLHVPALAPGEKMPLKFSVR